VGTFCGGFVVCGVVGGLLFNVVSCLCWALCVVCSVLCVVGFV